MPDLTSQQRKFLRALGHALQPVVLVGKRAVSDELVRSAADALEAQELVKVKFNEFKETKAELLAEIARRTNADVVGIIGNVGLLYKWQPEAEKRQIELP
ncbi:MAG: ribosome assembly RNA-binding protein YhbY [Candidatus Hydrogenedens sp.]|nr:ribosome assembly RNA-binding protein YhbY [Candidatus Hydrogenedens sp.]